MSEQCSKSVYSRGLNFCRPHRCSRKGVVEHKKKWYCRQHDPVEEQKREDLATLEYEKKLKAAKTAFSRRQAEEAFCKGLSTTTLKRGLASYIARNKNILA